MIGYLKENTKTALMHIAQVCTEQHLSISCAESCTGGGLAYAFTSVAGSSAWFNQSYVTYANSAKMTLVNVPNSTLIQHGAVSKATVSAMARGCAAAAAADIAIALSGIAGPGGGTTDKPVGTVWFGWCMDGQIITACQLFEGDREAVRTQAIAFALEQTWSLLQLRSFHSEP